MVDVEKSRFTLASYSQGLHARPRSGELAGILPFHPEGDSRIFGSSPTALSTVVRHIVCPANPSGGEIYERCHGDHDHHLYMFSDAKAFAPPIEVGGSPRKQA